MEGVRGHGNRPEFDNDEDEEPAAKKPGRGKGGRGRGAGCGRGRGRGRAVLRKPAAGCSAGGTLCKTPATPKPKAKSKKNPSEEELETPPKVSPATSRKAAVKSSPVKSRAPAPAKENEDPNIKASNVDGDDEQAGAQKRKRTRHSDEDKSFARRAPPKTEDAKNQWLAIRDAYNAALSKSFGAAQQEGHQILCSYHDCSL